MNPLFPVILMLLLAVSDDVKFVVPLLVGVFNTVATVAITVVLFRIGQSVKRYDRLEDNSQKRIEELGKTLHDTTTKLIDQKFLSMTARVETNAQSVLNTIDRIEQRLRDGDDSLEQAVERDHAIELKFIERLGELKEHAASKADVQAHQKDMSEKVDNLAGQISRLAGQVEIQNNRARGRQG